jgi:hypothetical protein
MHLAASKYALNVILKRGFGWDYLADKEAVHQI